MHVKVSDPEHLPDLRAFLRECGCAVVTVRRDDAHVIPLAAPNAQAARQEVGVYLAAWRIKSGAAAEIVD
jgi:hypothetical protein